MDRSGSPCRFGRKETEENKSMLKWGGRVYPPELRPSQRKASGTCSLRLRTGPVAPVRSPFQGRGFWSTKPDTTHWSSFGCTGLHRHPLSSAGNKGGGEGGAAITANGERGSAGASGAGGEGHTGSTPMQDTRGGGCLYLSCSCY